MSLLEVNQLSVRYGGLQAVDHIDLHVEEGQIVGLIGPNGAGKTTIIDALTGFTAATGQVIFDGMPIQDLAPHRRFRAGLARTWQSIELFDDLTVEENLRVACERQTWMGVVVDLVHPRRRHGVVHDLDQVLERVGLSHLLSRRPPELSEGERKLVGVARGLAGSPKLLLLDEPAAGLDNRESHALGENLRSIVQQGITVFLVDHDMNLVLNVCDSLFVLDFGRLIARGTPAEIRADEQVIAAYLGTKGTRQ
ncbi:MAG TPA: ABC transporter ATP-binding protein [Acidimicrobiales bacterium]|nr:ABC transporter ATP-binding protein [Acidimicrobiales bacterium]